MCHFQLLLDLAGHQHTFSGHHNLPYPKFLTLQNQCSRLPLTSGSTTQSSSVEEHWVTHAQSIFERDNFSHDDNVSWAAYCASNQPLMDCLPCITSVLPIFQNKVSTSPIIYHAMTIIQRANETLNPGQTPVITLDQPLYAIAKGIQNTEFNEDNYFVFLGPLHSEMLLLKLLGD